MSGDENRCGPFSFKLAQLRMEEGHSYVEYSLITGLSANRLRSLERGGPARLTPDEIQRIARFHGVSTDELLVDDSPIPDRFDRALSRLETVGKSDRMEFMAHLAEHNMLNDVGIDDETLRQWRSNYRRDRFREKGLLVI